MAEAATQMEGMESAKAEQMGEEMMNDMMKQFEKMGEKVSHFDSFLLGYALMCAHHW